MKQTDESIHPKIVSLVIGPSLGVDYNVFSRFYVGINIDYLMYIGSYSDDFIQKITKYNEDGSLKNISLFQVQYDSKFITLYNMGMSWSLTYRIY